PGNGRPPGGPSRRPPHVCRDARRDPAHARGHHGPTRPIVRPGQLRSHEKHFLPHREDTRMSLTSVVEKWVDEVAALTQPSRTIWCDGSKTEYDCLVEAMLRDGTLLPLNSRTYPNCYLT